LEAEVRIVYNTSPLGWSKEQVGMAAQCDLLETLTGSWFPINYKYVSNR
jgi:hypothetical protein